MLIEQLRWRAGTGWPAANPDAARTADLVLVFADTPYFQSAACYDELRGLFPNARILGCSSSGNVLGTEISDGDMVASLVRFESGQIELAVADVPAGADAGALAAQLVANFKAGLPAHVFALADGLSVNGSDLARGLNGAGQGQIAATGGLAGDGTRFGETWVMADAPARRSCIAVLGFFGGFKIKSGCFAGWQEFGAERVVTRSRGNVVYEIDQQPALALYKKYLADQAADLPGSGLRFPLSVYQARGETPIIRTLLGVSEADQSLTFAGDVGEGWYCKLMKTNLDQLIDSAGMAAQTASIGEEGGLVVVVSCVGRRLVLGQLTEEELEIVSDKLGAGTAITGFYSYGELAPFSDILQCQLHNQTMTLTVIRE